MNRRFFGSVLRLVFRFGSGYPKIFQEPQTYSNEVSTPSKEPQTYSNDVSTPSKVPLNKETNLLPVFFLKV
uniref:Uncharacterized protein n=1 Tax=Meloidogyne enterolobii TaxID=390850 RepID=A0A6V7UVW6_MELEN|nr:unnamed protein product [Meloidogyne enterolobii]